MGSDETRRTGGAEKRTPKLQRAMQATSVGAAWVIDARKPPVKKRTARPKSPHQEGTSAPWLAQNWSFIAAAVAALFSIGTFLHSSGWLSAPAKQDDVVHVVEKISQLERRTSESDARIAADVQMLTTELKEQRGAVSSFGIQLSRTEGKLDEALRSLPRSILRGHSMQNDAAQ